MSFVYLALATFSIGVYGVLTRRDIIAVLASVEVMLGSATLLLVGLASITQVTASPTPAGALGVIGLIIIVLAAAEAAVGLGLLVSVGRRLRATRVEELTEVKG